MVVSRVAGGNYHLAAAIPAAADREDFFSHSLLFIKKKQKGKKVNWATQHDGSQCIFYLPSISRGLLYETGNCRVIHSIFLPSWSIFPLDHFILDCLDEFLEDDKLYACACPALKQLPIDLLLTVCK